ncbi:GNAT family N-acetyltransferase [Gallaecimonas mangrovi]|uniref:GNAT family N-acetyltransferase n=1 Tax=Gallaecimonas mangrovi TaxID=2291597 RepID=UPI001865B854|nr:GNAT family protein [Gallaecimonas mangrovi]
MVLETPRLRLRPLTRNDRDFYFAIERHPSVMAFVSEGRTDSDIEAMFASACKPWQRENEHWLSLVVEEKASGLAIGLHGFKSSWAHRQAELGFLFLPEFQGKGYALEASKAVLSYARSLGFHKATAVVTAGNQASAKLLEKCGFEREGVLKEHFYLRGAFLDDWHYGLLLRHLQP